VLTETWRERLTEAVGDILMDASAGSPSEREDGEAAGCPSRIRLSPGWTDVWRNGNEYMHVYIYIVKLLHCMLPTI